jgi:hypothetical protein
LALLASLQGHQHWKNGTGAQLKRRGFRVLGVTLGFLPEIGFSRVR